MKIKNWLLPQAKNNYHPYLLRPLGLASMALVLLLQPAIYNEVSANHFKVLGYASDVSSATLYDLTNQQRSQAGLGPLSINTLLTGAAEAKAADMFAKNYWAHISPDGLTPWTFISNAGYTYVAAGENLAKDFSTSYGVMSGWMGSTDHRANILSSAYKEMGIAVENGNLLGQPTTLVVAMYGAQVAAPAYSPPPAAPPQATPTPTAAVSTPSSSSPEVTPPATEAPVGTSPVNSKPTLSASSTLPAAVSPNLPKVKGLSVFAKMTSPSSLNWGQQATIFLLSIVFLISLLKHTLVWRLEKRGRRRIWLRAHPIAQMTLLLTAIIITFYSSYGIIL